jgi:hypothetical protein
VGTEAIPELPVGVFDAPAQLEQGVRLRGDQCRGGGLAGQSHGLGLRGGQRSIGHRGDALRPGVVFAQVASHA